MIPKRLAICLLVFIFCTFSFRLASAQEKPAQQDAKTPNKNEAPEPRSKDGKRLLTSLDLMKVATVGTPRISPDSSRVAYAVGETKMEKDKEWKTVT